MKFTSELSRRLGLGLFFLVFGLLKLINGKWFVEGPYGMFYGMAFPVFLVMLIGIVQIAMALSFFMDKYSKESAWIAVVMMASTIIATWPKIMSTFTLPPTAPPPGFLFFSAVPILFMALSEAMKKE